MSGIHLNFQGNTHHQSLFGNAITPHQILRHPGAPLGRTPYGPATFDPWTLKEYGYINALICMIMGDIGYGKTTLAKVLAMRMRDFSAGGRPMRISVDDIKINGDGRREYELMVETLSDSRQVDLMKANLNLLDPAMGMSTNELLDIVELVIRHIRQNGSQGTGQISDEEGTALTAALFKLTSLPSDIQNLNTLMSLLNDPDNLDPRLPDGQPLRIDKVVFNAACSSLTQVLNRLYLGDFAGMLSGNDSLAEFLSQDVVSLDYSGLDEKRLTLVQTLIWSWKASAQRRNDTRFFTDIMIGDENHEQWRHDAYAIPMYKYIKTIRQKGGMIIMNSHRISDYLALSNPLAGNMLEDVTMWFFGHMSHKEALVTQARFELSDTTRQIIEQLRIGEFVFFVPGNAPVPFELKLTDLERTICESDQANKNMLASASTD